MTRSVAVTTTPTRLAIGTDASDNPIWPTWRVRVTNLDTSDAVRWALAVTAPADLATYHEIPPGGEAVIETPDADRADARKLWLWAARPARVAVTHGVS